MPKARKPTYGPSPCFAAAMRKASRRLTQLYDRALEQAGLRSTQLTILYEVDRRSDAPPTIGELARVLVMDRSALGHNLRPLRREGLVEMQAGQRDRRRQHVVLTARGKAKLREVWPLWEAAQERFYQVFGESEAAQLRATLLALAGDRRLANLK